MTPRLSGLVIGVTLIAIGFMLLLRNLGVIPGDFSLWPVVLLAVGVVLLISGMRQRDTGEAIEAASLALDGARQARMVLKHGAGTLDVTGTAAPGSLFDGTFAGGVRQEVRREGDRLDVTLRHPADIERLARQSRGLAWTVALGQDVGLDLELQSGASRARLDLAGTAVRDLRLKVGASDVDVRLPSPCRVSVSAGAADVRLHVPEGAAAAITNRSALATVDVDERRFPRSGQGFRSPGYDEADRRVDIHLEGGVASFRVD